MKKFLIGALALSFATIASAVTPVANGTVSVAALYDPVVNTAVAPNTFTAVMGGTSSVSGTGGFSGVTGLSGTMNGKLLFSNLVGTTINQNLADFFVFKDGMGGTYNFSTTSVLTRGYANTPGVTSSFSLYVLGNTVDTARGFSATPTSLTLSFNSTSNSAYSASATLAVPPEAPGVVPEPTTWALLMVGFGLVGYSARRRRNIVAA